MNLAQAYEEKDLVNKLKASDKEAFRFLIEREKNRVIRVCNGFVRNHEEAEDLSQEVFIEIFNSIKVFRGESKLSTWIYKIAVRKSLDHLKARKASKREGIHLDIDLIAGYSNLSTQSDPESELIRSEYARILEMALEQIPVNQATAFRLSKIDLLPQMEIAEIMETSVGAVESLLIRAKSSLRKVLEAWYEENFRK